MQCYCKFFYNFDKAPAPGQDFGVSLLGISAYFIRCKHQCIDSFIL
jgi:hypothetical protein